MASDERDAAAAKASARASRGGWHVPDLIVFMGFSWTGGSLRNSKKLSLHSE
jgi:hypothetical protein